MEMGRNPFHCVGGDVEGYYVWASGVVFKHRRHVEIEGRVLERWVFCSQDIDDGLPTLCAGIVWL